MTLEMKAKLDHHVQDIIILKELSFKTAQSLIEICKHNGLPLTQAKLAPYTQEIERKANELVLKCLELTSGVTSVLELERMIAFKSPIQKSVQPIRDAIGVFPMVRTVFLPSNDLLKEIEALTARLQKGGFRKAVSAR